MRMAMRMIAGCSCITNSNTTQCTPVIIYLEHGIPFVIQAHALALALPGHRTRVRGSCLGVKRTCRRPTMTGDGSLCQEIHQGGSDRRWQVFGTVDSPLQIPN